MRRFIAHSLFLFWSASLFATVPIYNPSGVCINRLQWVNNPCYPWYGSVVQYSTSSSPPCPGSSELEVIPCSGPISVIGGPGGSGLADGTPVTINPDGSAQTGAPQAQGTQPVPNPGTAPIIVGQTLNGNLTGNYVVVPPGGMGSLPVQGNPGDPGWGIMPMPPGTVITSPNPGIAGPGGSINIGNGTPTFPPNSGIGYLPIGGGAPGGSILPIVGGGNSDYPIPQPIPDPPDWGTPGSPIAPPPSLTNGLPNIPPGYTEPTNINGTGTISFPTVPTNSLGSNVEAGFSALAQQDSLDSQAIVKAIQAMDAANQTGHAGVSNAVTRGDNILAGMSNHLANIDTSTQQLTNQGNITSNQLSQIISNTAPRTNSSSYNPDNNTSTANGATAAGAATLQGLGDKFNIDPSTVGGAAGTFLFTVPGQGTWDMNPLSGGRFPAVALAAPWVRTLSQWAMTAWFLFWLVGEINQVVRDATHLPQGGSAEASPVLGSASALIAAGVVMVALTVLITYISSVVVNSVVTAFLAHPFGSGGGAAVQAGISLLDAVFDIGLCLSLMAQRLALSFYLSKAYFVCAGVVRFAVG